MAVNALSDHHRCSGDSFNCPLRVMTQFTFSSAPSRTNSHQSIRVNSFHSFHITQTVLKKSFTNLRHQKKMEDLEGGHNFCSMQWTAARTEGIVQSFDQLESVLCDEKSSELSLYLLYRTRLKMWSSQGPLVWISPTFWNSHIVSKAFSTLLFLLGVWGPKRSTFNVSFENAAIFLIKLHRSVAVLLCVQLSHVDH